MYLRPYMDFSTHVAYFSATACDSSDASGKLNLYFSANFSIGLILSGDTPITSMPILPNCGNASWNAQASLVQPGVSAFETKYNTNGRPFIPSRLTVRPPLAGI